MVDFSKVHSGEETYADVVKRMKAELPPGHPSLKTMTELAREQGIGPFKPYVPRIPNEFALYDGFEDDVRRMRRGLEPIGPRK